jgi:hypothetical protein
MSRRLKIKKIPQVTIDSAKLQDAQERVSKAAQRIGPTTRQAKKAAATGVTTARTWSAPKLDRAGHYVEDEVGPRVGAMLRRTAGRVEPKPRRRRGIAAFLLMIGGALGAVGAIATRRRAQQSAQEPAAPEPAEHLSAVSKNEDAQHTTS